MGDDVVFQTVCAAELFEKLGKRLDGDAMDMPRHKQEEEKEERRRHKSQGNVAQMLTLLVLGDGQVLGLQSTPCIFFVYIILT